MRRFVSLILFLLLMCAFLPVQADDLCILADAAERENVSIALKRVLSMNPTDTGTLRELAAMAGADPSMCDYRVQQGSASNGRYAYFVLENQKLHLGSVWVADTETWKVCRRRFALPIDHGNDMTWNGRTGQLIAVNNKPHYDTLTFLDPETLEVTGTRKLPVGVFCIAYNESRNEYAVGLEGGMDFAILNADFEVLKFCPGRQTGLVTQGADCDERYIYFPQWKSDNTYNCIMVYDWNGDFVQQIPVNSSREIESLFHIGTDVYIAFNGGGGYVYRAQLQEMPEEK